MPLKPKPNPNLNLALTLIGCGRVPLSPEGTVIEGVVPDHGTVTAGDPGIPLS